MTDPNDVYQEEMAALAGQVEELRPQLHRAYALLQDGQPIEDPAQYRRWLANLFKVPSFELIQNVQAELAAAETEDD